ncbi:MAG: hypothetical protein U0900_18420 [Myxococcota bacterium]
MRGAARSARGLKKRATRYDANAVVLTEHRMADYYACQLPKPQQPTGSTLQKGKPGAVR